MSETGPYSPPAVLINRHVETILPSLIRRVAFQPAERERVTTPDNDFLDLDWYRSGSRKCVIISHGLEGNSERAYVRGMARAFFSNGFDALAWNFRGCSGEVNRQLRFYHSGATDDLGTVIRHAAERYDQLILVGFSLGGNLTLKYLGEGDVHPKVFKGIAFSVPVNLHTSCVEISKPANRIYAWRFLRKLKQKVRMKAALRSDIDVRGIQSISSLIDFDDRYTGPIHGFTGAVDYYTKCSSLYFLGKIRVPTLLVNALNDPFLARDCYPDPDPASSLQVEYPEHGGHVGFTLFNSKGLYWSELRALAFVGAD